MTQIYNVEGQSIYNAELWPLTSTQIKKPEE